MISLCVNLIRLGFVLIVGKSDAFVANAIQTAAKDSSSINTYFILLYPLKQCFSNFFFGDPNSLKKTICEHDCDPSKFD